MSHHIGSQFSYRLVKYNMQLIRVVCLFIRHLVHQNEICRSRLRSYCKTYQKYYKSKLETMVQWYVSIYKQMVRFWACYRLGSKRVKSK